MSPILRSTKRHFFARRKFRIFNQQKGKTSIFILLGTVLLLFSNSCDRKKNSENQHNQNKGKITQTYDSLSKAYSNLNATYQRHSQNLSPSMHLMYNRMQNMESQMNQMHRQMMSGSGMGNGMMGKQPMQGMGGMGMQRNGGNHMMAMRSMEWQQQMMAMNQKMEQMQQAAGNDTLATMHRHLMGMHQRMMNHLQKESGSANGDQGSTAESTPQKASQINGYNVFQQNCAVCHGANGRGVEGVFPPVNGSKFIRTGNSIPVRILLHGLQGSITVQDKSYDGVMPAFGARLSHAEIAAVINHLRNLQKNITPDITTAQVDSISEKYKGRTSPWQASDFKLKR